MTSETMMAPAMPDAANGSRLVMAHRIVAALFAVAILEQALTASLGLFDARPGLIDMHRQIGDGLALLALIGAGIAIYGNIRGVIGRRLMWIAIALVPLVIGQLMMGYATRESTTAIAWHIPLGVALMSLTTANAVLAAIPARRR
jgi:hypothetical protein